MGDFVNTLMYIAFHNDMKFLDGLRSCHPSK